MAVRLRASLPLLLVAAPLVNSQVLFTGETGGKGSSSVFITSSAAFVPGFTTVSNSWAAYTRGVHDRIDAFGFYGAMVVFGQTQQYAGVGSNIGILKRASHGLDVSFFSFCATPFNRRDQASTVSAAFAPIASRPVRLGDYSVTLYGGYLRGESFGQRANKLFTPPKGTHNGIVGVTLPISRTLSLIAEYNPGIAQQNIALALLYVFPR